MAQQSLNALIPMSGTPFDLGNALASGAKAGNALMGGSPDGVHGTPIPYDKGGGVLGMGVITKDGRFQEVPLPGNYKPSNMQFLDLGHGFQPTDPRLSNPVGPVVPKSGPPPTGFVPPVSQWPDRAGVGPEGGYMPGTKEGLEASAPGQAKESLSKNLEGLTSVYMKLDELGSIVNPDRGTWTNLGARAGQSGVGQAVGGAVGTEAQSLRARIVNMQPLLVQTIRQATGMSARGMDSNRELEFYLKAATDPTTGDIYSNLAAIQVLDDTFGMGGILERSLPPDVYQRVKTQADLQRTQTPINITPDQLEPGAMPPIHVPQGQPAQATMAPPVTVSPPDLGAQSAQRSPQENAQVIQWAREAIQSGVPEQEVIQRLQQLGISLQ